MRAAPVRNGRIAGSLWLTPSGKRTMHPPSASRRTHASIASTFFAGSAPSATSCERWNSTTCRARTSGASIGFFRSVLLAVSVTMRRSRVSTSSGSTNALVWFATISTGPRAGTFARPCTSIRRKNPKSAARHSARMMR